jgi:uncharacterized protein YdhG (YjbR/CyaY superfamily)
LARPIRDRSGRSGGVLAQLRETIVAIVGEAEWCISYGMRTFKLRGKTVAGFATAGTMVP